MKISGFSYSEEARIFGAEPPTRLKDEMDARMTYARKRQFPPRAPTIFGSKRESTRVIDDDYNIALYDI